MAVAGLQNVSVFGPFFGESTTSTSSVLRMWRELEGDHTISSPSHGIMRQQRNTDNHAIARSEIECEENESVSSEQSIELGESERESVRQIFRGWKRSGAPQWLVGENEGELVTEADHQENRVRRPIRRLCGRQTLVDLLLRAQCERKAELQRMSEQKPVSEFAHRNRIQALLRGRFLRNEILIADKRQSSVAESELYFLRQRQTVSDLREEFLSKLDTSASTSSNNVESDSSANNENHNSRSNPTLVATQSEDNEQEVPLSQSRDDQVSETGAESHQNDEIEPEAFSFPDERVDREVSMNVESVRNGGEQIWENTMSVQDEPIDVEHADSSRNSEQMDSIETSQFSDVDVPSADLEDITNQETERWDAPSHLDVLQDSEIEARESSSQQQIEILLSERTDHNRHEEEEEEEEDDDLPRNWHETFSNQWFEEIPETTNAALDHGDNSVQEPVEDWQSHDLQNAIDSWLLMPSSLDVGVSLARFHYDHFPDDETTRSMEIRQLSSRRRVSSLLRSSFRESLDQVLQSHVERQVPSSHVDLEEEEETSPPVLIGQDDERLNVQQSVDLTDFIEGNQYPNITEPNWLFHANSHPMVGTEWEIINELRIEMSRLHQRMDQMQGMLEACTDMQVELQCCIRQEVSAALNRTILTRDKAAAKGKVADQESQWEVVRKGICCICAEKKINSLLYRCGHMCTCYECAVKLVRDNAGKCPMCRAPIVEAVRAYFIH